MVIWSKNQGINIVAPYGWIFAPVQLTLSGFGPCNRTGSHPTSERDQSASFGPDQTSRLTLAVLFEQR